MVVSIQQAPPIDGANTILQAPFGPNDQTLPNAEALIPPVYHDSLNKIQSTSTEELLREYITHELTTPRLTPILNALWLAGRPVAARPLHRQIMMGRTIIITENIDMHLLWIDETIYIKPLPPFLLCHSFWTRFLNTAPNLHAHAMGLLLSYIWLINHPSDHKFAHAAGLLPEQLTWGLWKDFCSQIAVSIDFDGLEGIADRYRYGELRLSRINWIYRLKPSFRLRHFVRGYYYMYRQYDTFFQRNFGWMLTLFVFLSVVLSGLQVGLGTDSLENQQGFQTAAYWTTVLTLGVSAGSVAIILLLFVFFVLDNALATILFLRKQKRLKIYPSLLRKGVATSHNHV